MEKLRTKEKVSYGLGDAANNLTFSMVTTYLLVFYTDVFGISAAAVGTLFLIARLWDAVNDPMMGALVDRMNSNHPAGKFRPYLRWGMIPLVILAVVMFFSPDLSDTGKLIYAYVTYILFGMAYTFINIPYGSLASVMTNDPVDRSSLATYRGVGSMLGMFAVGVVVIPFVNIFPDWSIGFPAVMAIFGVITIVFYLLTYKNTKERIKPVRTRPEKMSLSMFTRVLKNGPFIILSLMSFFTLASLLVNQSVGVYFFRYNLDNENLFAVFNAINMGSMVILIPLVPFLAKKFGKKNVTLGGFAVGTICFSILYFIPAEPITFITLAFIAMKGIMIPNILVWAFISDVIDYGEWKSGVRQEGTTYSMYSFMRKLSQAGAGWIAGMGLSLIGYVPNAAQTAETLIGIKVLMVLIPAIASAICFLIFKFGYFLDDEKMKQMSTNTDNAS